MRYKQVRLARVQRVPDAQVTADANEAHVEDGGGTGEYVAGDPEVADAPIEGPAAFAS